MPDEKDRYGDKLRDVERAREDKYFSERDRDLVEKMRARDTTQHDAEVRAEALMRCPKDGEHLNTTSHLGITVEECPRCSGTWIDKGELEEIAKPESSGWLARFLGRPR